MNPAKRYLRARVRELRRGWLYDWQHKFPPRRLRLATAKEDGLLFPAYRWLWLRSFDAGAGIASRAWYVLARIVALGVRA